MPKREAPLEYLSRFIPAPAVPRILQYLNHYKVHLTVTRERKTVLGDYRHATTYATHRISVNSNLNQFAFLITLIHEIAHLVTFEQFGNRVMAHGKEWKGMYALLLKDFLEMKIFPEDIRHHLKHSVNDLPASSCSDETLMRLLRKYDIDADGLVLVEQVPEGHLFDIGEGRVFKRGKKLRKRFQCVEVETGRLFLFSAVYEVRLV